MFGSAFIAPEHLLLGILREDRNLVTRLGFDPMSATRREVEALAGKRETGIATSMELPLSIEAKRALAYGAEECDALGHRYVDTPHLLLGLMRLEASPLTDLLRRHGVEYAPFRQTVTAEAAPEPARRTPEVLEQMEASVPRAASLQAPVSTLQQLVEITAARLRGQPDAYGDQPLKREPWTRKEALGHLIDWAIAHQHWITRALLDSRLQGAAYPGEAEAASQEYGKFPWMDVVDLWILLNGLLIHLLLRVPQEKLAVPCRIGIAEPVPLSGLIDAYIEHCQDITGQILAHL